MGTVSCCYSPSSVRNAIIGYHILEDTSYSFSFSFDKDLLMNKKITSTVLLFLVFVGFLWWGLSMLTATLTSATKDGESIVYALLLLGCAGYALVSILLLPRKKSL